MAVTTFTLNYTNMTCIIVDDEPNAIEVLKRYVEKVESLQLLGTFRNPVKAIAYMQQMPADVIFLDINMPHIKGTDLLQTIGSQPLVIFTTAYTEYAVTSYELDAVDYLVKPIAFERFLKAVNRARERHEQKLLHTNAASQLSAEGKSQFVFLKSGAQVHKVLLDDIRYVEKQSNYLSFNTTNKKILVRGNMNEVFELLPPEKFCQVHKSFVVALDKIDVIEAHQLSIGKTTVPIGNSYRDQLRQRLNMP